VSTCIHTGQHCPYAEVKPPAVCLPCPHAIAANAPRMAATPSLPKDLTERVFQARVMQIARDCGWGPIYHTADSRKSAPGFPDIVMTRRGNDPANPSRLLFAELKTMRGRVSDEQQEWIDALLATGSECYTWRPSDLAEIERVLR
jgi:hypothetical protein